MRFRVVLVTAATALAIASSPAKAYFFLFFIPGQALETIEGKKGQNCVSPAMKVGDQIRSVNGDILTVKSLSGTSVRCKQPERPILAELEFTASATFSAKAGIELPGSFKPKQLNNIQRFNGGLLFAKDDASDIGIYISSVRRDFVDLDTYASNLQAKQSKSLDDVKQSDIEHLKLNNMDARRFVIDGKVKNLFGTRYTTVSTVLQGDNEVVLVEAWTPTSKYEKQKAELNHFAGSVVGLSAEQQSASVQPPNALTPASGKEATNSPPEQSAPAAAQRGQPAPER